MLFSPVLIKSRVPHSPAWVCTLYISDMNGMSRPLACRNTCLARAPIHNCCQETACCDRWSGISSRLAETRKFTFGRPSDPLASPASPSAWSADAAAAELHSDLTHPRGSWSPAPPCCQARAQHRASTRSAPRAGQWRARTPLVVPDHGPGQGGGARCPAAGLRARDGTRPHSSARLCGRCGCTREAARDREPSRLLRAPHLRLRSEAASAAPFGAKAQTPRPRRSVGNTCPSPRGSRACAEDSDDVRRLARLP